MALFINLLASRKIIGGCVSRAMGQLSRTNFTGNDEDSNVNTKQKKPEKLLINLVGTDNVVKVIAKEDAEKIAKSRNLKLSLIEIPPRWMLVSGKRPVYQFLDHRQVNHKGAYNAEAKTQGFKGMKHLSLKANISDNDLETKVKQGLRFLEKNYKVSVRIETSSEDAASASKLEKLFEKHGFVGHKAGDKKNLVHLEYSPKKKETQSTAADTHDDAGKIT